MTLYLIIHSVFDVGIVFAGIFVWRKMKSDLVALQKATDLQSPPSAASLEEYQKEFAQMRVAFQERLAVLNTICDGARRILTEGGTVSAGGGLRQVPTREATELQEVVKASVKQIPTLEHIEATKERMKRDLPIDLRSILKDQLA